MNLWSDRLVQHSDEQPQRVVFSDERGSTNFHSLNAFSRSFIAEVKSLGLSNGNRILLALPRSVELASVVSALMSSEISALVLDRSSVLSSLASTQVSLDASLIICLKSDVAMVQNSLSSSMNDATSKFSIVDLESPIAYFPAPLVALVKNVKATPSLHIKWFLQTSGSTRQPKLVAIGPDNIVQRAQSEIRDFGLSKDDRLLNNLTFAHDLGLNQVLSAVMAGIGLRLNTSPLITSLAKALLESSATGITGTPMMWRLLFSSVDNIFPGLRYVTVSGGSLEKSELDLLQKRFPGASVFRTYGQTETFRSLMHKPRRSKTPKSNDDISLGEPIEGVDVSLHRPDGTECGVDEEGELFHRGSGMMLEYWNDPESTRAKITSEGLATGDIFRRTADNSYIFVGRKDDMIKRFEQRFQISEVESVLRNFSGSKDVVVVTKPATANDPRQYLLCAFIEMSTTSEHLEARLADYCKQNLAPFKIPDSFEVLDQLPRTASLKPDRAKLKQIWMSAKPVAE